jgi:hypothetical protein
MKRAVLALVLLAAPASAQLSAPQVVRYGAAETGALATMEIHTVETGHGRLIHALRPGEEPAARLAYTDEIPLNDTVYMGNQRAAMFPNSAGPVSLFQVMPGDTHRYSPSLFGLCTGKGVLFVGLEPAGGSIRLGVFDHTRPVRLYVIEETFEPDRISFTLCRAIDLAPA